jgi:nucleotidyltransferase/DNA polymerase involved in DNA repair
MFQLTATFTHCLAVAVVAVQFGDLSTEKPEDDRIKQDSNGSIIAVSYEARKYGVKR